MNHPICVVVGMGPGVSMSVAKKFASRGFKIIMLSRNKAKLESYLNLMESTGYAVAYYPVDVRDFVALKQTFDKIKSEQGAIEVLVYNTAVLKKVQPSALSVDSFIEDFKVNVAGALVSAQEVIPEMKAAGKGTILFTGGGLALQPYYEYASLAVGKAGIRSLAQSLHQELNPYGIKVGTVTIAGMVREGTHFDPKYIAEKFWELHQQSPESKEIEIIYR